MTKAWSTLVKRHEKQDKSHSKSTFKTEAHTDQA